VEAIAHWDGIAVIVGYIVIRDAFIVNPVSFPVILAGYYYPPLEIGINISIIN
jgi:hypothetical protein